MKTTHSFNNNVNDRVYKNIQLYGMKDFAWELRLMTSIALTK